MTTEVITQGGGEALYYIFNAIAMITGGSSYVSLIRITLSFGVIWASFRTAFNFPFGDTMKWFMGYLVLYNAMLVPKQTVLITDKFDPSYSAVVDNVPIAVALIGGYTSQIGNGITELFDQAFALPDDLQYSTNGFLFGTKIIKQASMIRINNSELSSNMEQFITQCVLYDISYNKYTVDDLKSATDIWGFLVSQHSQSAVRMFTYSTSGSKEYVTCLEGAVRLENKWDNEINSQMTYLYRRNFGNSLTSDIAAANYISSSLQSADNYLFNNSKTAMNNIRQNLMINALNDASYSYGSSDTAGYSSLISSEQTKGNFAALAEMAEEWVPLFKTFFEAIFYGIFPLVFLLFLLPMGYKLFTSYIFGFIWLQTWAPLYAVLHLLMTIKNKSYLSFASGGQTLDNFVIINQVNDKISMIAGMAVMFIPYISLKFIPMAQSTIASIGQMMGGMLAPATGAASQTASEMTRGNLSLGNTSSQNHNFDNTTAHKHDTSFLNQTYGGSIQQSDGSVVKYTGDGGQHLDTSQVQTNLTHDMKTTTMMSNALQSRAGISQTMGHNLEQESLKYEASAIDTASRMAHTFNKGKESGESWTKGVDTDTQRALENIDAIAKKHSFSLGLSGEVNAGKDGKMGKFGLGGKIGGHGGYNYEYSKEDRNQLTESMKVLNKASQEGRFSIHDSEGKSLNEELNSSYSKYQQLSNKASSYYQQANNLSNEATRTKSLEGFVTTNEASGFQKWAQEQKGLSFREITDLDTNPDRSQSFQKLADEYMQSKVESYYSKEYGKDLMNMQVNQNSYNQQSTDFTKEHQNDLQNHHQTVKDAYNNTQIDHIGKNGIDNSSLVNEITTKIKNNYDNLNNE
jgi:conjugal transfer mating pair stabilization protein TraG